MRPACRVRSLYGVVQRVRLRAAVDGVKVDVDSVTTWAKGRGLATTDMEALCCYADVLNSMYP
jgi:hypothetical protein